MWRQVNEHPASGIPQLGIPPTESGRPGLWRSSGLVDRQRVPQEEPGTTVERGRVPQVLGEDLLVPWKVNRLNQKRSKESKAEELAVE